MGAIYRNGFKYGDGNGVAQNPVLAIKLGDELRKPENGIVELPDEAITVSATGSDLNISTSEGKLNELTVYGKSEVVNNEIISAGEGYAVVDLGTLAWTYDANNQIFYAVVRGIKDATPALCSKYDCITGIFSTLQNNQLTTNRNTLGAGDYVIVKDDNYTNATAFKNSLNGVILAYQLADPTQGNAIAIKTDNGSGIDGTMATFTTGTPLRGMTGGARDFMVWDGTSGEVTKNCAKVNSSDLTWYWNSTDNAWQTNSLQNSIKTPTSNKVKPPPYITPNNYTIVTWAGASWNDKTTSVNMAGTMMIKDSNYDNNTQPDFDIIYELATPTTQNLTSSENASIASLRIFTTQTHIQNNAGADMTVEAYAGTENGKAVNAVNIELDSMINDSAATNTSTYSSEKIEDLLAEAVPKKIDVVGTKPKLDEIGEAIDVEFSESISDGSNAWTDGKDIYYSLSGTNYIFDKATSTWSTKTWSGLTSFYGKYIWTDGDNIYCSNTTKQYILDKSTSTWSTKTWTGLTSFDGNKTWTDGENIYHSNGTKQYILDKSTSTWLEKTWTGLTNLKGQYIWTDGENIYYSNNSEQYVLNKSTSTWSAKTWAGLTAFFGYNIWTDGENIYHSNGTAQHILNKSISTWLEKTWTGTGFIGNGSFIWTDGENIYYSDGTINKRLIPKPKILSVKLR